MDIDNMKAYVTVAELKSLSAAAIKMNHLQSNMTAKIKKIEAHYGQQLFIRSAKGMELTSEGRKLYRQYKKMLVLWEETELDMSRREMKLRLGTMQSVFGKDLTDALTRLYESHADLSVTLKTGTTLSMEHELIQGNIDLAFTIGKADSPQLSYKKLGTEEMVLIGKRFASGLSLESCLHGENWIILTRDCLYAAILERLYAELDLEKGEVTEVGILDTLLQLTSLGMGISLMSKNIVMQHGFSAYTQLPEPFRYVDKYLVTRAGMSCLPWKKASWKRATSYKSKD